MNFINIAGAASDYRFRIWPGAGGHTPMAGTYLIVAGAGATLEVLVIGVTTDLSALDEMASGLKAGQTLFTRLGVSRTEREATCADLAASHPNARIELDKV